MKINCIVVDDEPVSRDILIRYIEEIPALNLTGICKNAFEANDMLVNNPIDLMFLDINMPKLSGMKFYKSLSNPPMVIFTTAYPEFALEGFEVEAVDYLLKPISLERFIKAVSRVSGLLKTTKSNLSSDNFILLNADKKVHKVDLADIHYIEAMGDYVKVYLSGGHLIVHDTLQRMQNLLPWKLFYRVHRSFIIAINKFNYIEGNRVQVGERSIPIGQKYHTDFMKLITNIKRK